MREHVPLVVSQVVANDMCVGCGACVAACPGDALAMRWNDVGFLVPVAGSGCDSSGSCIEVCPFNPAPRAEHATESELAERFLSDAPNLDQNAGRYFGTYVGHSREFRMTSSSGGMATYIASTLLREGEVDHVLAVLPSNDEGDHYSYQVASSEQDLLLGSGTRYFPVTADAVLASLKQLEGRVAFVGVGCFVKAVRLVQARDPDMATKVRFVIGIICGGLKSRFFTDYLASRGGTEADNIREPAYRIKDPSRAASDYAFGHVDAGSGERRTLRMRLVGDMWGTGLFKANACDFCEDVTTELADVSLGDAWMAPYVADGKGTSVIVARSPLAQQLIADGVASGALEVEALPFETFKRSQQGSFNHRQIGLPVRVAMERRRGRIVPPKRFAEGRVHPEFRLVQYLRRWVRGRSLTVWKTTRSAVQFERRMAFPLRLLRAATNINRRLKGVRRRLQGSPT